MKRLLMMLGLVAALLSVACGGGATTPDADGTLVIVQEGFKFTPNKFESKAGQKVRLVLRNDEDKDHEFMIGRKVVSPDGFPNGFEHDFFEGVEVVKISGPGMIMNPGMEMESMEMDKDSDGMAMDKEKDGMAMDKDNDAMEMDEEMHGYMVMLEPSSESTIIEFIVPASNVGSWEFGCFEDDGDHWVDGMKGTLEVVS